MVQRVLVIDSDPGSLRSTADLLQGRGVEVVGASSLEQIQQALSYGPPRVVLIEPDLDGIDGFELCRTILDSHQEESPMVLIASHRLRGKEHHDRAREVGAQLFLERPAKDTLLAEAIVRVVERSAASAVGDATAAPPSAAPEPAEREVEDSIEEAFARIGAAIDREHPGADRPDPPPPPVAAADPEPSQPAAPAPKPAAVEPARRRPALPRQPAARPAHRLLALAAVGIVGAAIVGLFVYSFWHFQDPPGQVAPRRVDPAETMPPAAAVTDEPAGRPVEIREPDAPVPSRSNPPAAGEATALPMQAAEQRGGVIEIPEPMPERISLPEVPPEPARDPPVMFEEGVAVDGPAPEPPTPTVSTERPATPIPSPTSPSPSPSPEPAIEEGPAPVAAPVREDPPTVIPDSRVKPRYPLAARRAGVGGTVVLEVSVRRDGSVEDVEVIKDPSPRFGLGQAAATAVRRWRFEPGRRDGRPVDSVTVVQVNFAPN